VRAAARAGECGVNMDNDELAALAARTVPGKCCFVVIDNQTGQEPDCEEIALHEDWADGLIDCDMEGFAIQEDGTLILMDECGQFVYCPEGRFKVTFANPTESQSESALLAQVAELQAQLQRSYTDDTARVNQWSAHLGKIKELQAQVAALTAERDAARQALRRLWELTTVVEYTLEDITLINAA